MKIVRKGCFETNSSSTHSLILCADIDREKIEIPVHSVPTICYTKKIDANELPLYTDSYGEGSLAKYEYKTNVIDCTQGAFEFGWQYTVHSSFSAKLNYLLAYIRDYIYVDDDCTPIESEEDKYNRYLKNVLDVINEYSPISISGFDIFLFDREERGGIDHQSAAFHKLDYILENKQIIADFLFSPNSYVLSGNDND